MSLRVMGICMLGSSLMHAGVKMSNAPINNKGDKMRTLLDGYRQAVDATETVRIANGLAEVLEPFNRDEFAEAWKHIATIWELAGTNPKVHERRAKVLKDELVLANRGLIRLVAKSVLGVSAKNAENLAEAEQEGAMGVMRAVDAFDPSRGLWSICARHWIRYYVQTCAHHQTDFPRQRHQRMPPEVVRQANAIRAKLGREPLPSELTCKGATVTAEQWRAWTERAQMYSFDRANNAQDHSANFGAAGDHSGSGSSDFIADEKTMPDLVMSNADFDQRMRDCIDAMSPRNRLVLTALFIDGKSTAEVSAEFDISMRRLQEIKVILAERLKKVLAS